QEVVERGLDGGLKSVRQSGARRWFEPGAVDGPIVARTVERGEHPLHAHQAQRPGHVPQRFLRGLDPLGLFALVAVPKTLGHGGLLHASGSEKRFWRGAGAGGMSVVRFVSSTPTTSSVSTLPYSVNGDASSTATRTVWPMSRSVPS